MVMVTANSKFTVMTIASVDCKVSYINVGINIVATAIVPTELHISMILFSSVIAFTLKKNVYLNKAYSYPSVPNKKSIEQ